MKKVMLILLVCLLLSGCGSITPSPENTPETFPPTQLGNPWKNYNTLEAAETACGLNFPLEDVVANSYRADTYRVMNGELLEVTYRDDIFEVIVRMQSGADLDLCGLYVEFESSSTSKTETYTITGKIIKDGGIVQLISKDGYSYSFYAPNHYWGDSNADFLAFLDQ